MHVAERDLIVSATDLSSFLACGHVTTQDYSAAHGGPKAPKFDDPGVEVLQQRGHDHEARILAGYEARGLNVVRLDKPPREEGEPPNWRAYAAETARQMAAGVDVIHQGCFFDGRWLGLPDFLIKVDRPSDLGDWSYEVVDAKLSRTAKAGAVLQICSYSEMVGVAQGVQPERMHLALGGLHLAGAHGEMGTAPEGDIDVPIETFRVTDFAAYYRSVKRRFESALADQPKTYPEPCSHCDVCKWSPVCKKVWREDDHLSLVAGITTKHRAALEEDGTTTLEALAQRPLPPDAELEGTSNASYEKIREQARVQLEGRLADRPKYELVSTTEPKTGLLALPERSPGDLFFDIEGDPHAFGDGLEYLLGWVDVDGAFTGLWAFDRDEERARFEEFIDMLVERLERWPDLHVYHYAAYEKTALTRLASRYGTREAEVDRLLRGEVLVDLYRVVRQGVRASVESYSIKKMEPLYGFEREVELRAASSALNNFEAWLQLGGADGDEEKTAEAEALLDDIERYNEDDCVSTLRLRAWLEGLRPELEAQLHDEGLLEGALPRPEPVDGEASDAIGEEDEEVRVLVEALTAGVSEGREQRSDDEHAHWLLAQLLSWHRREKKSVWWEYFRMMELDDEELITDGMPVGGLVYEGVIDTIKRSEVHRYRYPPQDHRIKTGREMIDPVTEKSTGEVFAIDELECTIDVKRGKGSEVPHPTALVPKSIVPDRDLKTRLRDLARDIIENGLDSVSNRAGASLLRRQPPRAGQVEGAPLRGMDEESLDAARRVGLALDQTVLPIQGPPGSGKTFIGARMITELIRAGKRVGVTGPSHKVIVNLLNGVCEAADEERLEFSGVQKTDPETGCAHASIQCVDAAKQVAEIATSGDADLIAGTVWLWARDDMQGEPVVDVLVVDEAGQLSLANVLAASGAAKSLVLLGDPQQLDQPQKGVHPPGADVSGLEYLVGGTTLERDRGLFLDETWRLHPDLCAFNSELYYEGELRSRLELAQQRVDGPEPFAGAGLRIVTVEHSGNTSDSPEEVEVVRGLVDELLQAGATWVDREGKETALSPSDVLVVSPYNAQVSALKNALGDGVAVGTVDKFQGQEAPVVLYSMAASSTEDAPRGMEFLFNPNRTNVATSRAKCVVVLVGSPGLLSPDCRSVRQMMLANGMCRYEELVRSESPPRHVTLRDVSTP